MPRPDPAVRSSVLLACLTALLATGAFAGPAIRNVFVSPSLFNPSARHSVVIRFQAGVSGVAKVAILDRDRFPVRVLPAVQVAPGEVAVLWDGRDDRGTIVPDEVWNIRIELAGEIYDPSKDFLPVARSPRPRSYSRSERVLSYRLERPSRVRIEAGQRGGPMLKTLVNREPRAAGAVVERWNGYDDSGTIRVVDLPHFAVRVVATSLPENSIITRGNRTKTFLEYAAARRPASAVLAKNRAIPTHDRAGLDAFDDYSPELRLRRAWLRDGALRMIVYVNGPTAARFIRQPGKLTVYVDGRRVLVNDNPRASAVVTIPPAQLASGERRIAVNWTSDLGPAAAAAFAVDVRR